MTRPAALFVAIVIAIASQALAQDTLHFVPEGKLAIRDLSQIPWEAGPNGIRAKTIVGSIGSLTIAEIAPGGFTTPHHHTRQQVNVGLSGELQFQLDTATLPLHRGDWVMVGSDVMHGVKNVGAAPAQLLELQPVRRLDLEPPHAHIDWPQSATPHRVMLMDYAHRAYDSTKFANPMSNETTAVDVNQPRQTTINAGDDEEFVYVAIGRGSARFLDDSTAREFGPDNVIVIPPKSVVVLQSPDRNRFFIVRLSARRPRT